MLLAVELLFFPRSPLPRQATFIVPFPCSHDLCEIRIEPGANFFQSYLVSFHFLLWAYRERLQTFEDTNKSVNVAIPQIKFEIGIGHFRSEILSATMSRGSELDNSMDPSLALRMIGFVRPETLEPCKTRCRISGNTLSYRRCGRAGLRRGMGCLRGDVQADGSKCCFVLKQSGLRQIGEPATFSGSHRCTSYVRLWLGARSVFTAPTRPVSSFAFFAQLFSF